MIPASPTSEQIAQAEQIVDAAFLGWRNLNIVSNTLKAAIAVALAAAQDADRIATLESTLRLICKMDNLDDCQVLARTILEHK
jgi:hypothetical protein